MARRTREAIRLVEAWGADVVLVETVGVGQSETMVAEMTDIFVLLIAPGGGDELQGVKRGIMEMADLLLVNKADGTHAAEAVRTCADYAGAMRLLRPRAGRPGGLAEGADGVGADRRRAGGGLGGGRGVGSGAAGERQLGRAAARAGGGLVRPRAGDRPDRAAELRPGDGSAAEGAGRRVAAGEIGPDAAADALLDTFAPKPDQGRAGT